MEKRAALFTEKGVIPFGLEALVDRPAFIHHTPRAHLGKRRTRGKRDGKRVAAKSCEDKNRLYPPPFLDPSFLHLPSIVKTAATCPPLPLVLSNLSMFTFLQKRPETELLYPSRGKGGKVECTLCVARGKSRTPDYRDSVLPLPSSSVWPRYPRRGQKPSVPRFFKRLVRSIAPRPL